MKEYFKGIVWPREPVKDKHGDPAYRYVVVGMLITDRPIRQFEGENERVCEGRADCMGLALENISTRPPHRKLGDATDVLLSLGSI